MKKCKLIVTIPALTNRANVNKVISNQFVYGARWNTGVVSPLSEAETLETLNSQCNLYKKQFWVDIKGRQLRIKEWGQPLYNVIKLNHAISVKGGAKVYFRGEEPLNLVYAKGNEIFVDPIPRYAVGAGQSVNIISDDIEIQGYLTPKDIKYLEAARSLNINNVLASFVESDSDIIAIKLVHPNSSITCKIESKKGIENLTNLAGYNLMAARDDLYIELNSNPYTMNYSMQRIIAQDPNAICASRIFTSLEHSHTISYSDFEDVENMYNMGYRTFMLCDNICNYRFDEAIEGWKQFINN